jgi:hypothetical protein
MTGCFPSVVPLLLSAHLEPGDGKVNRPACSTAGPAIDGFLDEALLQTSTPIGSVGSPIAPRSVLMGDNPMEFVHEVTANLENKPGRLAKICSALAKEKVDVRALSVMETDGPSVLKMITTNLETTKHVLTSLGTEFRTAEVLAVPLENRTGSLAEVLEKLAKDHINVEYAYASTTSGRGKALGVFHTSNPKRAAQILSDAANSVPAPARSAGRRPLHSR